MDKNTTISAAILERYYQPKKLPWKHQQNHQNINRLGFQIGGGEKVRNWDPGKKIREIYIGW